ncbi:hypothetical protein GEMRC1_000978 [Eukaryota sp. GEM-RC1]
MASALQGIRSLPANTRGIPAMFFIEDLDAFMRSETPENAIQNFHDNYSKYKLLEQRLSSSIASLKGRIPEIEKNLEAIEMLVSKTEESDQIPVSYQLADNVSAAATANLTDRSVCLWLGAEVMVKYSFEEAQSLLKDNLRAAETNLERTLEDLDFVRVQITTTEVNTSRVFNYDVKKRRTPVAK